MTMDNEIVQSDVVPAEGTPLPAVVVPPTPSPEEILNQKIADAVTKALATETEKSRREIQSAKDKAMAEVQSAQRRARFAEGTMAATRSRLHELDPDTAKEMELAEYRAKEQGRQAMEQEEAMARQQAEFHQQFHSNLTQFIANSGVDPADKRLDWAGDAPNYLEAQRRVLDSVTKIQKENIKAMETSIDVKIKEAEKRIKKELGGEDVNSVSTQIAGGVSGEGIPTSMAQFRKWIEDIPQSEYEKKYAARVNEMMREGKIK